MTKSAVSREFKLEVVRLLDSSSSAAAIAHRSPSISLSNRIFSLRSAGAALNRPPRGGSPVHSGKSTRRHISRLRTRPGSQRNSGVAECVR